MTDEHHLERTRRSRRYRGKRIRGSRQMNEEQQDGRVTEERALDQTKRLSGPVGGRLGASFLWSLLLTIFSLVNPFLINFATNSQTQDLYAGLAMHSGQAPYLNFVGSDGVLYYLLVYLGTFFGSRVGLALLQLVVLTLSGFFYSKIANYYARDRKTVGNYLMWFYLLLWSLAFGGFYAAVFALPCLLASVWFLIKYFDGHLKDEAFIRFGLYLAIGCLIEPSTILFWLVAGFYLLGHNLKNKRKARGFYQFLACLFGFLLVGYLVGYYILDSQIVAFLIPQSIVYGFLAMNFGRSAIFWSLVSLLLCLTGTGLLQTFVTSLFRHFRTKKNEEITTIALIAFLVQLFFMIGGRYFELNQLLLLLPLGMTLAVQKVAQPDTQHLEPRRKSYLRSHYFLPLVALCLLPAYSLGRSILDGQLTQEREQIAQVINQDQQVNGRIYVWDSSAMIYLKTNRISVSRVITPEPYLDIEQNKTLVAYNLGQNNAQYIAINKQVSMPTNVMENIRENYTQVQTGTQILTLYKKK
ncbi:hypothetical protein [Streptococcus sp. DD13]|uniref:hypothetical protein n=1 Tax=Streptococcus sp. DD13 TaxID=1777881 RepID=UPI000793D282|nr:hypothetical protein [Streptococcus sp. DD13]KXT77241.1 hypothetical protein STRDD13_01617 [Streptococcus sp. DD13]